MGPAFEPCQHVCVLSLFLPFSSIEMYNWPGLLYLCSGPASCPCLSSPAAAFSARSLRLCSVARRFSLHLIQAPMNTLPALLHASLEGWRPPPKLGHLI